MALRRQSRLADAKAAKMARAILKIHMVPDPPPPPTPDPAEIIDLKARIAELEEFVSGHPDKFAPFKLASLLAKQHGFSMAEIRSERRDGAIVKARHIIMRTIRDKFPTMSWPQLGLLFNREHSTVIFACQDEEKRARRLARIKRRREALK